MRGPTGINLASAETVPTAEPTDAAPTGDATVCPHTLGAASSDAAAAALAIIHSIQLHRTIRWIGHSRPTSFPPCLSATGAR